MDVDQLVVVAVDEVALFVEHVREPARHAGTEVDAGVAEHDDNAAGHVFAAVVAAAFDDRVGAGVAHCEAFAGHTGCVQCAAGGAVQAGVADDRRFTRFVARGLRRLDDDAATGHALADVVVGVAFDFEVQATGIPHAQALARCALELDRDRAIGHAEVAPATRDLAGQARTDRAMPIADRVMEDAAGLVFDRRQAVGQHRLGQFALVERLVVEHAVLRARQRHAGRFENRRQVEVLGLVGRAFGDFEQVGAADQLLDRAHAEAGHQFARFLGDELEVVHHHLGQADEVVLAQHVVLRRHTGGAVVQVADAQVLAAQRHHRRGAEAERFGAENRRLDHVQAGLQAAVGLHPHLVAQIVHAQRLVGFRQAEFPRRAGVLDAGQRRGTGAAVIARDRDQVGVGLGHAGRDRADAGARHQLDRHQRLRIDLLEIEDQLRQVFDRVDVVMRRRRDQRHARPRVAQLGDLVVDLVAGQLAAFAGLGALRDLDLQHFGVDQVFRRDAEAARCHLLDLRRLLGAVARRVFAAFAGIAAAAEAVHRNRQRFMRFRRQRAERHAGRVEALEDAVDRLDLVDRNRRGALELEQIADHRHRARVHDLGVGLVVLVAAGLDRLLQHRDHVRVVGVVLAAVHVLVQAALFDRLARAPRGFGDLELLFLKVGELGALDPRHGGVEAGVDHFVVQTHGFEQLRAAIRRDGADAHLRDDLVQTLVDALAIALRHRLGCLVLDLPAARHLVERGVGEIRIDHAGAVADQAREVMRVTRGGGLDDDVAIAAQAGGDQRGVDGTGGQQRVHRQLAALDRAVGQHQHDLAGANRGDGFFADMVDGRLQADRRVVVQVDDLVRVIRVIVADRQQCLELGFAEHRRVDQQARGALRRFFEHALFGAELAFQRHHDLLAQRIDRRIGDLREHLPEVVVQRACLLAEHRERRVVAHRADRFLAGFGEHAQHLVALFERQLEHLVIDRHRVWRHHVERVRVVAEAGFEPLHVRLEPLLVRLARGQHAVDVFRTQQRAGLGVDGQDFARTQAALLDDVLGAEVVHADFRRQHDVAVAGDHIARRTQTVAVEAAGGIAAVHDDHTGRAVPGLHVDRVVFVERTHVRVEVFDVLPGRRDQRAHRLEHVHAAGQQQFEHVVHALAVGALHRHQRHQFFDVGQVGALELLGARLRPHAVAADRVDLAVVRQIAERVAQAPARQRVGREALVEHAHRRFEQFVSQVRIELRQELRHHQSLVDDDAARQAGDVEIGVAFGFEHLLDAAAQLEQLQLEGELVHVARRGDEHLLDHRHRAQRFFTKRRRVGRHRAEAQQLDAMVVAGFLECLLGAVAPRRVLAQEHVAGAVVVAQREAELVRLATQERVGLLHQQAAAVAGLAVGRHRTTMGHPVQRRNRRLDQFVAGLIVHVGDQAEAARILFEVRTVQAVRGVALEGRDGGLGHGKTPG